ncbi:MAG: helix-turn-helix domain-containing protein [Haloferacaceae archaeon]
MSAQTYADRHARFDPPRMPDAIDSAEAKLVYLYLAAAGGGTVDELHRALDLQRLALFPVLDRLRERGLVAREDGRYVSS